MSILHKKFTNIDLDGLEEVLGGAFDPIEPRPDFVHDLGGRLAKGETPPPMLSFSQYLMIAGIGLAIALLVVAIGVRALNALLEGLGVRKHLKTSIASPVSPRRYRIRTGRRSTRSADSSQTRP